MGYVSGKSICFRVVGLSDELGTYTVVDTQLGSDLLRQILQDHPAKPMSLVSLMTVSGPLQLGSSLREQGFQDDYLVTYVSSSVSHAQQRRLFWRAKSHEALLNDLLAHDIESSQIWNSVACVNLTSIPTVHLPKSLQSLTFGHGFNQWDDLGEVFDLLLQFLVGIPSSKHFGEFGAVLAELLGLLSHLTDLNLNLSPCDISPLGHDVLDFGVEVVEFIEELDLVLGVLQFWI